MHKSMSMTSRLTPSTMPVAISFSAAARTSLSARARRLVSSSASGNCENVFRTLSAESLESETVASAEKIFRNKCARSGAFRNVVIDGNSAYSSDPAALDHKESIDRGPFLDQHMVLAIGHELRKIGKRDQLCLAQRLINLVSDLNQRIAQTVKPVSVVDCFSKLLQRSQQPQSWSHELKHGGNGGIVGHDDRGVARNACQDGHLAKAGAGRDPADLLLLT